MINSRSICSAIHLLTFRFSGSAAHGDYVFGWKDDTLQKAMDNNCNGNANCAAAGITYQQPSVYDACTVKQQAPEAVDGCKLKASMPMKPWSTANAVNLGLPALPMGEPGSMPDPGTSSTGVPVVTTPPTTLLTSSTSTTKSAVVTTTPPVAGPTVAKYGQCGGQGWTGGTVCASGSTCKYSNDWYSQCL